MKKIYLLITLISLNSYIYAHESLNFKSKSIFSDRNSFLNSKITDFTDSNYKTNNNLIDTNYVPIDKFYHADWRRFLLDGTQPNLTTKIRPVPTLILTGLLTGAFIVQHELQQNTIWKQVGPFNIMEDFKWAWGLDKCGHFYGGYAIGYLMSESLMLAGFSWDAASIWGGVLGLTYQTYIEILDGYSIGFGFSPSDFYADIIGSSYFVAQHFIPFLQNFNPKFMYVNPGWLGEHDRVPHATFIDNYSAQTFYMTINVYNLLPESWKKSYPKWLDISVGYAIYSLFDFAHYKCEQCNSAPITDGVGGNRKLLIALDVNLPKLFPDASPFFSWLLNGMNLYKVIPTPTLEIGIGKNAITKFYLLYPFPIKLGNLRL